VGDLLFAVERVGVDAAEEFFSMKIQE